MQTIELEANSDGKGIRIDVVNGNPAPHLPRDSGACQFEFLLTDNTNLDVRFKPKHQLLDVKDDSAACPPPAGRDSNQIVGLTRKSDHQAGFTDNNNNKKSDMPVTYQLNFECNDPSKHPIAFDPTIINGGKT